MQLKARWAINYGSPSKLSISSARSRKTKNETKAWLKITEVSSPCWCGCRQPGKPLPFLRRQ